MTIGQLTSDGGDVAVATGAGTGSRHAPRIRGCRFQNQTTACVQIVGNTNGTNDPRLFQNVFANAPRPRGFRPAPFDLRAAGAPPSFLWNDFVVGSAPMGRHQGKTSATLAIPPLGGLIGQSCTFPWWTLPGVDALGFVTSDGLRKTMGQ